MKISIAHLVIYTIQQSRHSRHDGRPEGFHVLGKLLDVTTVESDGTAHHIHAVLAATFQHVRQREEADHYVLGRDPVITQLHYHRAIRRHDVLVRQHYALRVAGGTGSVAYCAEIGRVRRHLRMVLLRAEAFNVVELVQLDAAVLRPLIRRRPRLLHHHQLP